MRGLKGAGLALSLLALGGCASTDISKGGGNKMDHVSPRALAVAFHQAITQKNVDAIAECIAPDYRTHFRDLLSANRKYSAKLVQTADLVEQEIAPEPAARIRQEAETLYLDLLPSPLEGAVEKEKVNWQRVTIKVEADKAYYQVDGKYNAFADKFVVVQRRASWYVAPNIEPKDFAAEAKRMVRGHNELIKRLNRIQHEIKNGMLDREGLEQEFWPKASEHTAG